MMKPGLTAKARNAIARLESAGRQFENFGHEYGRVCAADDARAVKRFINAATQDLRILRKYASLAADELEGRGASKQLVEELRERAEPEVRR